MNKLPFVSIIVPCRNEEKFIAKCINSIINNDYPKDKIEILVFDGMSNDNTRKILEVFAKKYSFIKLFDNTKKIQSHALNMGVNKSVGEIIMRMDAHTIYEKNYISKCVKYLFETNAANIGGVWITLPSEKNFVAKAIAYALSSPFGVGNAYFRIGAKEIKEVDTVPFGCYRKEIFNKVGIFDEKIISAEDDEFNYRLRKYGGKIILVPEIKSYYYARKNIKELWQQYFNYGFCKARVLQKHFKMMQLRQFIPFAFILGLISSLIIGIFFTPFLYLFITIVLCYLITNLFFSFKIAKKQGFKYFFIMPIIFATLHISYGLGFLTGIIKFAFRCKLK